MTCSATWEYEVTNSVFTVFRFLTSVRGNWMTKWRRIDDGKRSRSRVESSCWESWRKYSEWQREKRLRKKDKEEKEKRRFKHRLESGFISFNNNRVSYPFSPNRDQHQISPHHISALRNTYMRIKKMINKNELSWCLKCYYDQKITFIFSSDFETRFVKHSPSEIISVNFEKKTVNLNCNFPV